MGAAECEGIIKFLTSLDGYYAEWEPVQADLKLHLPMTVPITLWGFLLEKV